MASPTAWCLRGDRREMVRSRLSYIEDIASKLGRVSEYFPTADQERLYKEALGHVVHVLSGKRCPMPNPDTASARIEKRRTREYRMIEILNKLHYMERRRLYDPPSNNEIGYYRVIKKHVISIATFLDSRHHLSNQEHNLEGKVLECFSPFEALHYVEQFREVQSHITHISNYVLDGNTRDYLKPLFGMSKVERPEILWDRLEKSNNFYHHKFYLAFMDLRCSHHSMSPPTPDEKKCYDQLLSLNVPSSSTNNCEANVYLDDRLLNLFEEWLIGDIRSLEKVCVGIAKDILTKISFPVSWERVMKHRVGTCYLTSSEITEDPDIINFHRELVDKCQISYENLPHYIEDVGRCVQLMSYIHLLINGLRDLKFSASELFDVNFGCIKDVERIGWEALHALTLFNNGSSIECRGRDFLQKFNSCSRNISFDPCCEQQPPAKKAKIIGFNNKGKGEEDENGNDVEMLKGILEEFREIEDWRSATMVEKQLIYKICQSIVSSVHFFTCTLAYEQMTHAIRHYHVDAHPRKPIERTTFEPFDSHFCSSLFLNNDAIGNFLFTLRGFMQGLQEKLTVLQE